MQVERGRSLAHEFLIPYVQLPPKPTRPFYLCDFSRASINIPDHGTAAYQVGGPAPSAAVTRRTCCLAPMEVLAVPSPNLG